MLSRESLLSQARQLTFCATPIGEMNGMPLPYDHVSARGAAHESPSIVCWPAICLKAIAPDHWLHIRTQLLHSSLSWDDMEGTELTSLARDMLFTGSHSWSEVFRSLLDLPSEHIGRIYCLFDTGLPLETQQTPVFCESAASLKKAFEKVYVRNCKPWEDMTDEELRDWLSRVEEEFLDFPLVYYSFQDDSE